MSSLQGSIYRTLSLQAASPRRAAAGIMLFSLFVAALLVALVAGLLIYASDVSRSSSENSDRLSHSLLVNTVRAADSFDALQSIPGPEGKALVFNETTEAGTFSTRIYLWQGQLCEEYAAAASSIDPVHATVLFPTSTFDFTFSNDLLTLTTDQGSVRIALRSVQGSAPSDASGEGKSDLVSSIQREVAYG